ncbi:MAG: S1C family serine protease [Kineosporiaceae bacterium]
MSQDPYAPPAASGSWFPPESPYDVRHDALGRPARDPAPPGGGRRGFAAGLAAGLITGLIAGVVGGAGVVAADRFLLDDAAVADRASDSAGAAGDDGAGAPERDRGAGAAAPAPDGSLPAVVDDVLPGVVSIEVTTPVGVGSGSGFVIDGDEGLVLTNNHVVGAAADGAGDITVLFDDGSQVGAEIVGREASYDLAVLQVPRSGLPELAFADSDSVAVGQSVLAVGAPLGLESTVTSGIVSALNRPVAAGGGGEETAFINAIQTDAAINPGNSGGPLVDLDGRVVGINSAIARAPGGGEGNVGLGFAIPSNQAERTARQLIDTGEATFPVIGVLLDRSYTGEGVRILDTEVEGQAPVVPGGPADRAGVRPGEVVLAIDGRPVTAPDELIVYIRAQEPGDEVVLTVRRGEGTEDVPVTLEASEE